MKGQKWLLSAILVIIIKHTTAAKSKSKLRPSAQREKTLPLARSFGINSHNLGKSSEDHNLGQEFIEQYQEMLRASQESFESFGDRDAKRLRRVVGKDEFGIMDEAEAGESYPRRRSVPKFEVPAVKRRARSQAVRRNKLNNQGIKSHLEHAKHSKQDYSDYIL